MSGITAMQRARAALRAKNAFLALRREGAELSDELDEDREGLLARQARTVSLDRTGYVHPHTPDHLHNGQEEGLAEEGRMVNGEPMSPSRPTHSRRTSRRSRPDIEEGDLAEVNPLAGLAHMPHLREAPLLPSLRPPAASVKSANDDETDGGVEEPEVPRPGWIAPKTDAAAVWRLFTSSFMNLFLISVPLGFAAQHFNWGAPAIFGLNFLSLVPLALILGEVTEDLALRFGDTIGGLLNATFGNVVELILSAAALQKNLFTVVSMSLIGSILSNLLLVLGFCFLCGGTKYKQQTFNMMVNKACCSLLFMACIALVIPTSADWIYGKEKMPHSAELKLSRATAILLAIMYVMYLIFQLKTHHSVFAGEGEDDAEQPALSLMAALGCLTVITIIVAICSEFLTGALEEVSQKTGLGEMFLGLIVLPIAGNAAEHITAVFVAVKDKMDLAIGVALGSSIQIAIFVLPAMVILAWIWGKDFSLDFDPFAGLILTLSVVHAYFVSSDGNSNWLMGVQLLGTYTLIALLYLFLQNTDDYPKDAAGPALGPSLAPAALLAKVFA